MKNPGYYLELIDTGEKAFSYHKEQKKEFGSRTLIHKKDGSKALKANEKLKIVGYID